MSVMLIGGERQGERIPDYGRFANVLPRIEPQFYFGEGRDFESALLPQPLVYEKQRFKNWRAEYKFYVLDGMDLCDAEKIIQDYLDRGIHPKDRDAFYQAVEFRKIAARFPG